MLISSILAIAGHPKIPPNNKAVYPKSSSIAYFPNTIKSIFSFYAKLEIIFAAIKG